MPPSVLDSAWPRVFFVCFCLELRFDAAASAPVFVYVFRVADDASSIPPLLSSERDLSSIPPTIASDLSNLPLYGCAPDISIGSDEQIRVHGFRSEQYDDVRRLVIMITTRTNSKRKSKSLVGVQKTIPHHKLCESEKEPRPLQLRADATTSHEHGMEHEQRGSRTSTCAVCGSLTVAITHASHDKGLILAPERYTYISCRSDYTGRIR